MRKASMTDEQQFQYFQELTLRVIAAEEKNGTGWEQFWIENETSKVMCLNGKLSNKFGMAMRAFHDFLKSHSYKG